MGFDIQTIKKKVSGAISDYKLKSERDAYYNAQKKAQVEVANAKYRDELLRVREKELEKQAKARAQAVARQQAKAQFTPGKANNGFWSQGKLKQSQGFLNTNNQLMGTLMGKPTKSFNIMGDIPFAPTKQVVHKAVQHQPKTKPITLNINGTNVTIQSAVKKKLLKNSIKKKRSPNQSVNDLIWKY